MTEFSRRLQSAMTRAPRLALASGESECQVYRRITRHVQLAIRSEGLLECISSQGQNEGQV